MPCWVTKARPFSCTMYGLSCSWLTSGVTPLNPGFGPMPLWRWTWLSWVKNCSQNARASANEPNRSGKAGQYFRVRNCASEKGFVV